MGLKSKFSDVHIPQDLSWPQFVFQNFEANGSKTAIVSKVFKFSSLRLFVLAYCTTTTKRDLLFTLNGLVVKGPGRGRPDEHVK